MERTEFIQNLFIAAMQNPEITQVGLAVQDALNDYDAMIEKEESKAEEVQQNTKNETSEEDYYRSLNDDYKELYMKMQHEKINKYYLKWLCNVCLLDFKPTWDEILTTDAVVGKPEIRSCNIMKWQTGTDGKCAYKPTGETSNRAVGAYKFDTLKVCRFLLSKRPRRTEFIENYLKYNS